MRSVTVTAVIVAAAFMICAVPDVSSSASVSEEYWCCGDHIVMSFGSDSANVSWTVTDATGNVVGQSSEVTLDMDASDYDTLYITQTVETGQGKSVKTVRVNLLHLNDRRISAVFYDEEGGSSIGTRHMDGSTVCRNGVFVETPEVPEAPEGKVFGGWFERHGDTVTEFDPTVPLSTDTSVFAVWLQTYRIMFVSDGGFLSTQTVVEGQDVVMPEIVPVPGKQFGGWFTDAKCKNAYVPGTPLDSNTVLYARWDSPAEEQGDWGMALPVLMLGISLTAGILIIVRGRTKSGSSSGRYR